jgi:hypothetical protein
MNKSSIGPSGGGKIYIEKGGVSPVASGTTPVPPKGGSGVPAAPPVPAPTGGGGTGTGSGGDKK